MGLLARREYSIQEIHRKLGSEYSSAILQAVIQRCQELDWLNETRMMTLFIRSRANRGYGPIRVLQELRLKGLVIPGFPFSSSRPAYGATFETNP